jgi:triacylglycerol lipase
MARWLTRIGWRPHLSGIDWNVGCPNEKSERLGWRLAHIEEECGSPVVLIGHSLGGVLARALAATYPQRVRQVVTLGSPARMEWGAMRARYRPALLAFRAFWHALNNLPPECGTERCGCSFSEAAASRFPSSVGLSAIFTRDDEVVDWRRCTTAEGENYEVSGGHASLVVNREVYRVVAAILSRAAAAHTNGAAASPLRLPIES